MTETAIACSLWKRRRTASTIVWILLVAGGMPAFAQVVLDGKFGTSGALTGPNFNVTDTMGATRGNNLFHSFTQFDLKAGDVATFSGPASIQNILTRVTGGNASSINGTIRSTIVGANFFLINPSGVIFGPKAVVNVSGSFTASTADYLRLADGARFVAALDADDSGLSTAPVVSFGFLSGNPGSLAGQQSTLKVSNGKAITLVGGDVTLDGGLVQAPGGQLTLVSVHSAGEVSVDPTTLSAGDFKAAFPQQGQISLKNSAQLDATGAGGGRIVVRSGQLTVDNSKIQSNSTGTTAGQGIDIAVVNDLALINGGQINCLSITGRGTGGNINLSAQSIRLDGGGLVGSNFEPLTQISTASGSPLSGGGAANGGDIVIQTGSLELVNSAQISSATYGGGNAGRIDITASTVRLEASHTVQTTITANTSKAVGGGNAGDIVIHTGTLDLLAGATLLAASFGSGQAGVIDLTAQSINILSGAIITAATFASGNGGNIQVTADSIHIDGRDTLGGGLDYLTGIQAVTTSTTSPAPGGSIHITAGSLDLEHDGSIFTTCWDSARGPAGNIDINAQSVNLRSGAIITAETRGAGNGGNVQITAGTITVDGPDTSIKAVTKSQDSPAPGGNIQLTAGSVVLSRLGSVSTTSFGLGPGGNVEITAGQLTLANESTILASGEATGPAGKITIAADKNVLLTGNSSISTSALQSSGGDISVKAGDVIQLTDSRIAAQAGPGGGGNITLMAPSLIYLLNSTLTAQAMGDGGNLTIDPVFFIMNNSALISRSSTANGGNITILSDYFFQSASTIDASAPFGLPGTVSVSAPQVDLSGSLIGLPGNLLDAESQLRPDCAVRQVGDVSSFIVLGRGGMPMAPGGFVPSTVALPVNEAK